jgi:hypothetical protein
MSAGIAGKDLGNIRGIWPETAIDLSTASSASGTKPHRVEREEDALVALAGRHVNVTSLAVQQQRFDIPKQC